MRPRLLVAVATLVLAALALLVAPAAAGATPRPAAVAGGGAAAVLPGQQPDAPADDGTGGSAETDAEGEPEVQLPDEGIIPMPNSGREPAEAGERGGTLQVLVFVVIVAGVGGIVAMIVRESRRNRGVGSTSSSR
jgi:hypothetical protein